MTEFRSQNNLINANQSSLETTHYEKGLCFVCDRSLKKKSQSGSHRVLLPILLETRTSGLNLTKVKVIKSNTIDLYFPCWRGFCYEPCLRTFAPCVLCVVPAVFSPVCYQLAPALFPFFPFLILDKGLLTPCRVLCAFYPALTFYCTYQVAKWRSEMALFLFQKVFDLSLGQKERKARGTPQF